MTASQAASTADFFESVFYSVAYNEGTGVTRCGQEPAYYVHSDEMIDLHWHDVCELVEHVQRVWTHHFNYCTNTIISSVTHHSDV
jgi:hypothetical protein